MELFIKTSDGQKRFLTQAEEAELSQAFKNNGGEVVDVFDKGVKVTFLNDLGLKLFLSEAESLGLKSLIEEL